MAYSPTHNETFFHALRGGGELSVDIAGVTRPDPEYRIVRKQSPIHVLEYIVRGSGHLFVDGQYFHPKAGDVYYLQPGTDQEYFSDANDPWEKLWINFQGPLPDALCDLYRLRGKVLFPGCPLEKEFHELHDLRHLASPEKIREGVALTIHRIFFRLRLQNRELTATPENLMAEKLKSHIEKHLGEKLSLGELSGLIARSPAQTLRIFRRQTGTTPYAYVQERRDFRARQYLENTDCTLVELAGALGFADEFYFSNWFKARTGVSPGRYRSGFRQSGNPR